jgi:hypothetical protein
MSSSLITLLALSNLTTNPKNENPTSTKITMEGLENILAKGSAIIVNTGPSSGKDIKSVKSTTRNAIEITIKGSVKYVMHPIDVEN